MARTIAEIYAEIADDKDNQTSIAALAPTADTEQQLLASLTSTSKVAVWRLWAYIVAVAIHTHEVLWDLFKIEVQAAAAAATVGTAQWYQSEIFKYQHGDTLVYNATTGKYGYATENTAVQVVKRCAIVENPDSSLSIKVAGLTSGSPSALGTPEQTGLASYIKKIRFAGTRFTLFSGAGDILRVEATIYYDASAGLSTVQTNVQAAINNYISNLPFNGELLLTKLVDAVQAVTGVVDIVLVSVKRKTISADPYSTIARADIPVYGYYKIDTSSTNTLTDTLTYIAQ